MINDKAYMMRRLRRERRESGLVEFRAWVLPETKVKLEKIATAGVKAMEAKK